MSLDKNKYLLFFQKNEKLLQQNYSGINERIFLDFIEECINLNKNIDSLYKLLREGFPLEYIKESKDFYRSKFIVNENVLIPRFESEILIEFAATFASKSSKKKLRVIDLGTGSGAIIISLIMDIKKEVEAIGSDIDEKALEVARKNLKLHVLGKEKKCEFIKSSWFEKIDGEFDIIVTNPPYIKRMKGSEGVHKKVHQYEPHLALYLNDEEYEKTLVTLFLEGINKLSQGGLLIMEGHEDELQNLKVKIEALTNVQLQILKDYNQLDRFLVYIKENDNE